MTKRINVLRAAALACGLALASYAGGATPAAAAPYASPTTAAVAKAMADARGDVTRVHERRWGRHGRWGHRHCDWKRRCWWSHGHRHCRTIRVCGRRW